MTVALSSAGLSATIPPASTCGQADLDRSVEIRKKSAKKPPRPHPNLTLVKNRRELLRRDKSLRTNLNKMWQALKQRPVSSGLDQDGQQPGLGLRVSRALHGGIDWLASGPHPQPTDIQNELLHQSLAKTRTLVIAITASLLLATIAAAMTAAPWAYAWVSAEFLIGSIRLYLMDGLVKAKAAGQNGNTNAPILAGLLSFCVLSAGCFQCVVSGQWPLISLSGISLASLIGAISSRNAGTPRLGAVVICILVLPYALATLTSPIPYLFIIGIQLPVCACGVIFVMLENYKVLVHLHHSERENRRLAQHDPLTGLANRALNLQRFDKLLKGLRSAHGKLRQEFMVFCLDLDGFKELNDSFGHAAGDAVLVEVAHRLRNSVRSPDFISRIGGDEFVILLPMISPEAAKSTAERIIASIAQPFDLGLPTPVHIGISIGSACAPDDGDTADELLRSADRALYEAKRLGKGIFVAQGALKVALAPTPDADARMAGLERWETGSDRSLLPFRSKSV
jgi:diguanylate cyclase (GGDEF)-like protein